MKWDIFSRRRPSVKSAPDDEVDPLIRRIERFAPERFREERATHYYHYRMMPLYRRPLIMLLKAILHSRERGRKEPLHPAEFIGLVRNFYDPRGRLNEAEAAGDPSIARKAAQVNLFFFGIQTEPGVSDRGRRRNEGLEA
jgi:hypothetical protein